MALHVGSKGPADECPALSCTVCCSQKAKPGNTTKLEDPANSTVRKWVERGEKCWGEEESLVANQKSFELSLYSRADPEQSAKHWRLPGRTVLVPRGERDVLCSHEPGMRLGWRFLKVGC